MEILLLGIYAVCVWLVFFKFKWLPWNLTTQVITITLPIVAMVALMLFLNLFAPASNDVRAMNYVIPIVPRVTGQVTEVPIQPNEPIKKGDVLFKIDPVPFQMKVKAAQAKLESQRSRRDNAIAEKEALLPRIDLARTRVSQFSELVAEGAGRRADLEEARSTLDNLESELRAAIATESQAGADILQAEADLGTAQYDLEGCIHHAPANGRVANLALRPGVRAVQFPMMPVMSFIEEDDPWLFMFFKQNEIRYVEPGQEVEIFLKMYPGRIIKCRVDSILWATAQGQLPISGDLPNTMPMSAPDQRIAVRLVLQEREGDLFLAAGARGQGTIYTGRGELIHIMRRVIVRIQSKLDWFVFKHLGDLLAGGH